MCHLFMLTLAARMVFGSVPASPQAPKPNEKAVAELKAAVAQKRAELTLLEAELARVDPAAKQFTKADYEAITIGMSYKKAERAVGVPGQEVSQEVKADTRGETLFVIYVRKNPDGSFISATFKQDSLIAKHQTGIK